MIVVVTGSRIWPDHAIVWQVLDAHQPTLVVHGACVGADLMAESWAKGRQIDYHGMPAKWGKRPDVDYEAGHKRNRRMLEAYPGALVLAFPTGKAAGTLGCIRVALELGHPLKVFDLKGEVVRLGVQP